MRKKLFGGYFTPFEWGLWISSSVVITLSFLITGNDRILYLLTSLLGITSLILIAKGNVIGQVLMVVFCLLYGVISYSYHYYGEMITYLGMSMPISIASVVTWMRHPFEGRKNEVRVGQLKGRDYLLVLLGSLGITVILGCVLYALRTENLFFSTVSVLTSGFAVLLSMKRCPIYALGYAANDVVLIVLWVLASMENPDYLGMVICFLAFLVNDLYGFVSWTRMAKRQSNTDAAVKKDAIS